MPPWSVGNLSPLLTRRSLSTKHRSQTPLPPLRKWMIPRDASLLVGWNSILAVLRSGQRKIERILIQEAEKLSRPRETSMTKDEARERARSRSRSTRVRLILEAANAARPHAVPCSFVSLRDLDAVMRDASNDEATTHHFAHRGFLAWTRDPPIALESKGNTMATSISTSESSVDSDSSFSSPPSSRLSSPSQSITEVTATKETRTTPSSVAWMEAEEEMLKRSVSRENPPILVVLDGVSDPQNVGAIARSALLLGASDVVVSYHPSESAVRASAGALEIRPAFQTMDISRFLHIARSHELMVIGLDASSQTLPLHVFVHEHLRTEFTKECRPWKGVVIVLGSEGRGISKSSRKVCNYCVSIPQTVRFESLPKRTQENMGSEKKIPIDSLNVSAAAAITLYQIGSVLRERA